MPLQDLRNWLAATALAITPSLLCAADLPIAAERFEGEVMRDVGQGVQGLQAGRAFETGTRIRTGADGRVELSFLGAPISLGSSADLLLHSAEAQVLRAKLTSGAMSVDTRASKNRAARDLRLNAGELRLRINGAQAWLDVGAQGVQLCLLAGVIDVRVGEQPARLDVPGQCLRQFGLTQMWSMVPANVLTERVALTTLRPAPAAPVLAKTPEPIVSAPAPRPVEPASERAPSARAAALKPVEPVTVVEIPPVPPPVVLPTLPRAEGLALKPAPLAAPEIPPPPAPRPILPATQTVALRLPTDLPLPGIPPAPVPNPRLPPVEGAAVSAPARVAEPEVPAVPVPASPSVQAPAPAAAALPSQASVAAPAPTSRPQPIPLAEELPVREPALVPAPPLAGGATPAPPAVPVSVAVAAPAPTAPEPAAPSTVLTAPETTVEAATNPPVLEAVVAAAAAATVNDPAEPVADDGRRWSVVLASFAVREPADQEVARLKAMGLDVEAREYRVGARHGFRVGMGRYNTREEADIALAAHLARTPEVAGWLAKY